MDKNVNILMSTYNGSKYLKEQIESILSQTYTNISLFIRDDGSTDGTEEILKEYTDNEKITVIYGKNIGFVKSFLSLLYECGKADYYGFSDQDDVWKEDKVECAVNALEQCGSAPALYCCNFEVCDEMLNVTGKCEDLDEPFTITKTIVNGQTGFGFTQMMNHKARELITGKSMPGLGIAFGHDTWCHLACICFGQVIYDKGTYAYCRRHGNNTSTQELRGGNIVTHRIWQLKQFVFQNNAVNIYQDVQEFYDTFEDDMQQSQKELFQLFLGRQQRLKKVFWGQRYRRGLVDEIAIRVLFLFNKI